MVAACKDQLQQCQMDRDDLVDQQPEVVFRRRQDGVDRIAQRMGQIVATHAVARLQIPDHRLDGRPSPQLAPDGRYYARFWLAVKTRFLYPGSSPWPR